MPEIIAHSPKYGSYRWVLLKWTFGSEYSVHVQPMGLVEEFTHGEYFQDLRVAVSCWLEKIGTEEGILRNIG